MKNLSVIKKSIVFVTSTAVICAGFALFSRTDAEIKQTALAADYLTDDTDAPVVYMTT